MFDYGGATDLSALRHILRFVTGHTHTADGLAVTDLGTPVDLVLLDDQVGLYAFSHPGIAATNVLALYGAPMPAAPDHDANQPPLDWTNVRWMGYPRSAVESARRFPRAALAEMADRTWYGDWSVNLAAVLP